jgi:hypothetical protein
MNWIEIYPETDDSPLGERNGMSPVTARNVDHSLTY